VRILSLRYLALSLFFLVADAAATIDRQKVEYAKSWAHQAANYGGQSIADLNNVTALEYCAALYELKNEGDYSAIRSLEADQAIILGRKGYKGYSCIWQLCND